MGAGMALMASPHAHLVPGSTGVAVFGALGAGSVATMLANGAGCRAGMDDNGNGGHGTYFFDLVAGCAAMTYMYAAHLAPAAALVQPVHHAHGLGSALVLGWIFSLYFTVAVASGGFRLGVPPPAPSAAPHSMPRTSVRRWLMSNRIIHGCEVLMSAGMGVMILRMI